MRTTTAADSLIAAIIDEGCGPAPSKPVVASLLALWQQRPLSECLNTIENLTRHAYVFRHEGKTEDADAVEFIADFLAECLAEPPRPCAQA